MDPATVAGLAIAVAQVTGACLKSVSTFVGPSQHSFKDLEHITSDLYSFNAAITNLQTHLEVYKEDQARLHALSGLEEPLKRSKKALDLIQTQLEDVTFARKVKKQVLGVRFDGKLQNCLNSLETSRKLFAEVLLIDQRAIGSAVERCLGNLTGNVTSIRSQLQTLDDRSQQSHQEIRAWQVKAEQQKKDDEDRKILSWLSSLNFAAKQNDVLSRRHEQTGAWFLDSSKFQDWMAGPTRMLWCPGIPGAGKTVLASIAVDYLKTTFKGQEVAVLCVFCNHADQGNQKGADLLASILEQLVQIKGVTDQLRMLYREHQTRRTRPRLKEISELLQLVIRGFAKVFVIIDALDECPETTRDSFVDEIGKLRSRAHLLVTSRHSSSVAHAFHDAIHLDIHASDTDLETYVRSKTQQDRHLARYLKQDSSLQEEIVAKIIGNARGMFLLVQLHLESLAKQKNKRDMRKALSSLPKELNETYDQAMERIRSQETGCVRLAERILAWISNARRPFSVKELQHALAVQPGENTFDEEAIYDEDILVSICAGLVTVDQESQVIRLVHYTTQDYFERVRSEMSSRDRMEIHIEIAKACITYLELEDFESTKFTHGEEHIEVSDELRSEYPFLDYAGENWGHHAHGYTEYHLREMICHLLECEVRLRLACEFIGESWIRDFGPMPGLTVLVHFGLRHVISEAVRLGEDPFLTCAIRYRDDTLVFLLVERDTDWHDNGNYTLHAQFSSFEIEGNETLVRLLADKGATVDLSVDNGEFLFTRSLVKYSGADRREPMSTLLELGATFDPQNITYYTPLMCAVIQGDSQLLSQSILELLQSGAVVNEKNEHGRDPLIYAALARNEAVVRPLLEAGADVHSRDKYGMTVLHAACEGGNLEIVKVLIEHGADISAQDGSGRTPISIATGGGHARVLRLLRGEGTEPYSKSDLVPGGYYRFNAMWHLIRRDGSVGLPEYKPVEAARQATSTRGYDEIVPEWVHAYFKEKENENDPLSGQEEESEPSKSDDSA